jgi:hypothetical protein
VLYSSGALLLYVWDACALVLSTVVMMHVQYCICCILYSVYCMYCMLYIDSMYCMYCTVYYLLQCVESIVHLLYVHCTLVLNACLVY